MIRRISSREAMDRLAGGTEVAFLDLREAGPFSEGHPLFAVPCPWSEFEMRVPALVPRREVPAMLIDGGDGIAEPAAEVLSEAGYRDVCVVDGGAPGWAAAGFTLFKGVHVPSKALGELAEEILHPRAMAPDDLAAWRAEGRNFLFYDCRPAAEYKKMTVPGAASLPNGELAHRLETLPPDLPVVVTCAGRTRGVIGAASLALIAPEREVRWLEDGTQGWVLAGHALSRDNRVEPLPPLAGDAVAATRRRADALISVEGLRTATALEIQDMRANETHTTYLFDVRGPEDAVADPLPAFTAAPMVQLVQATDRWIGVRGARVILADDCGLRAALAAYWLRALGFEPFVALVTDDLGSMEVDRTVPIPVRAARRIGAGEALAKLSERTALLVDVRPSFAYGSGHVAGAVWSIRSRLGALPAAPGPVVLIGEATERADLAAETLRRAGRGDVAVVEGGHAALVAAGARIVSGPVPLSEAIDVTSFAHGRHDGDRDASRRYLAWEKGLVAQLGAAERAIFGI